MSIKLRKNFLEGLETRGITIDEFMKYKYAGGNKGSHRNYFKICGLLDKEPMITNKCICNHDIEEQCYLANDNKQVLIIGNCCIKHFLPEENQGRHCEKCNKKHRNTKDNYCKDCRELCINIECFNIKKSYNSQCNECYKLKSWKDYCNKNKGLIRKCVYCDKPCGLYKRCFDCNQLLKNG
jgi:hypothetical protein